MEFHWGGGLLFFFLCASQLHRDSTNSSDPPAWRFPSKSLFSCSSSSSPLHSTVTHSMRGWQMASDWRGGIDMMHEPENWNLPFTDTDKCTLHMHTWLNGRASFFMYNIQLEAWAASFRSIEDIPQVCPKPMTANVFAVYPILAAYQQGE